MALSPLHPSLAIVSHAALVLDRPVKWIEDRQEHLVATTHSRDIDVDLELRYSRGRIATPRAGRRRHSRRRPHERHVTAEVCAAHLPGPSRIPQVAIDVACVGTNRDADRDLPGRRPVRGLPDRAHPKT